MGKSQQVIPITRGGKRQARPAPGGLKKTTKRIKLEGRDKRGRTVHSVLKATIIQPRGLPIHKQYDDEIDPARPDLPVSNVEDEDEFRELVSGKDILVAPTFNLRTLAMLKDNSTELAQAIRTMVVNTVGFGWTLRELPMTEEIRREHKAAILEERQRLTAMFQALHPRLSFTMLRKQAQEDRHSTGNGYLELISNRRGDLAGINHAHGHSVRLTKRDKKATKVIVTRVRPDLGFSLEEVSFQYRFRRFVQIRNSFTTGRSSGAIKAVWFKEAGDPRQMDWRSGNFAEDDETIPLRYRATELVHFKIYNPVTPYGIPIWIGNLFSLFGSRAAEEINFNTLSRNNVPSMFVVVENGSLTEASIERLQEFVESQISTAQNYSKFILLEGEALDEGSPNPEAFRIKVVPLTNIQQQDQLFQEYDANNRDKIRQAFRLPPIFVGRCHSSDTEYLTDKGWRRYSDIPDSTKLATKNPNTGAIEYQVPTARHSYDYEGDLLHLKNRGIDALVTPNHRMWTRPIVARSRSEKPWGFTQADSLCLLRGCNGGRVELPVSAAWIGEEFERFTIPRNDGEASWDPSMPTNNLTRDTERWCAREGWDVDGDTFLRFLSYFVAEGSTTDTPGPITLSQNEGPIADDMIETLKRMRFAPTITDSRPGELKIDICHVGLWGWLREFCGTDSQNKRFPPWVVGVSQRQLELSLDALVDGDGSLPKLGSDGSFTYSTTSRILNDQLHEICLKLGIALTSRKVKREGWSDIWRAYGHYDKRHLLHPKTQIEHVPYDGKVSCFTVPNGLLVTRRNGRVLISGNSDDYTRATADTSRDIADEQIFAPERDDDDHLINRFILSRWGAKFHKFRSNHPNITDDLELIRMMTFAEKSGGMTPRRADRIVRDIFGDDIGPLPEGIDLDRPFSLQFAEAQAGGAGGGAGGAGDAGDVAKRMVSGLVSLRKSIEGELDSRTLLTGRDTISNQDLLESLS